MKIREKIQRSYHKLQISQYICINLGQYMGKYNAKLTCCKMVLLVIFSSTKIFILTAETKSH